MKKIIAIVALLTICLQINAVAQTDPQSGRLVSDWIRIHLKLVRTTKGVGHVAYSRHFAYTSIAVYESLLPGNKNFQTLFGQLKGLEKEKLPVCPPGKEFSPSAGANAAYAAMLKLFYANNSNAGLIDSLEKANNQLLITAGFSQDQISSSSDYGRAVTRAIQEWAATDGADKANAPYTLPFGEGLWIPTAPRFAAAAVPFWKDNRTMIKTNFQKAFASKPPSYSTQPNSAFYKMVGEVYDVSQRLTEEQKNIASFWDDSPNGKYVSVFGHWSSILAQVIDDKKLPLMISSEAYVKMHVALYHAALAAWYGKYTYSLVRPITYIQKNIEGSWTSLIETPNHPEFPAAHATLSSSAATALTNVLGEVTFTDATYSDLGMEARSFSSFEDAAKEAGLSRLYGGIHYRFSIEEGLAVGRKTAEAIFGEIKFSK